MKFITYLIVAIVTAIIVLLPVVRKISKWDENRTVLECIRMRQVVEKRMEDLSRDIVLRLENFGEAVSRDREFSMKYLVEQDFLAPEVTEIAGKYMKAMGLTVLEVVDKDFSVISSGHSEVRVGASASEKSEQIDINRPGYIIEEINGEQVITFQARVGFACIDIPFNCFGGIVLDSAFLSYISPHQSVRLLLKKGSTVIGMEKVAAFSPVRDNRIIINDKKYIASSFSLPLADSKDDNLEIIVIMDEPGKKSLADLF